MKVEWKRRDRVSVGVALHASAERSFWYVMESQQLEMHPPSFMIDGPFLEYDKQRDQFVIWFELLFVLPIKGSAL